MGWLYTDPAGTLRYLCVYVCVSGVGQKPDKTVVVVTKTWGGWMHEQVWENIDVQDCKKILSEGSCWVKVSKEVMVQVSEKWVEINRVWT